MHIFSQSPCNNFWKFYGTTVLFTETRYLVDENDALIYSIVKFYEIGITR